MQFPKPLIKGKILKRYKRFFADIDLNGQRVTAHCPNTGSLKTCWYPGGEAYVSESDNPNRKLKYTLELTQSESGSLVGVNTSWPGRLVQEAIENQVISDWVPFVDYQSEVKINSETRLDGCLISENGKRRFIEIKNVTLAVGHEAQFPDAVTTRGQKHLLEMMELIDQGHEAEMVYVIQREDCRSFAPAQNIDPEYARLLQMAEQKGLIIRPLRVQISQEELVILPESLKYRL